MTDAQPLSGGHLIDGEFQSDKYPTTPRGKVPLSVKDPTAQDLLWAYAKRRRVVDAQFADDLEIALRNQGYTPLSGGTEDEVERYTDTICVLSVAQRAQDANGLPLRFEIVNDICDGEPHVTIKTEAVDLTMTTGGAARFFRAAISALSRPSPEAVTGVAAALGREGVTNFDLLLEARASISAKGSTTPAYDDTTERREYERGVKDGIARCAAIDCVDLDKVRADAVREARERCCEIVAETMRAFSKGSRRRPGSVEGYGEDIIERIRAAIPKSDAS